jgi:hypothetical protein
MRDPLAERRARREMFGKMDGIAIASQLRKTDHVRRRHSLFQRFGHADRQILEEQRAQRRQVHAEKVSTGVQLLWALFRQPPSSPLALAPTSNAVK